MGTCKGQRCRPRADADGTGDRRPASAFPPGAAPGHDPLARGRA